MTTSTSSPLRGHRLKHSISPWICGSYRLAQNRPLPHCFKLTEMCPQLKRLQMPLHDKDFSAAVADRPLMHVSILEELIVGSHNGPYTNAELLAIARCFDRRFPRVRSMKHIRNAADMGEKIYLMILALRSAHAEMEALSS